MRRLPHPRIEALGRAVAQALGMLSIAGLAGPLHAAPVEWTLNGDGFWDIATNWSSNPALPSAADDVTIDVAGLTTITYRTGATTINSLTSQENLVVSGGSLTVNNGFSNAANTTLSAGTLTLNGASTLASLTQSLGALGGSGLVTVSGASSWTGGTQAGSGTTVFNGALAIGGNGTKSIVATRTVTLNGATTWGGNTSTGGNTLSLAGGATVNNAGAFTDSNAFNTSLTGGTFNNSGTFAKTTNTTTTIGSVFNNTGTVNLTAGSLLMGGGGTSGGAYNLAAGTLLEFRNGAHTLNNVTTSGAGTLQISTDNIGADAFVAINGGTLNSAFLMSGSTMAGTDQVFGGPSTWTGGTITGSVGQSTTFGGTLTISGPNTKTLSGGRSINAGNTTWTGNTGNGNNTIAISQAGAFNNTGSFTDANGFDSVIATGNGGGAFNNSGTFNKQSNTTTSIGTMFNSTGTVNVNAGTLLMHGGGTASGIFNVANGAKLEYRNGNHALNNVTTSGAGIFEISTDNVGADATVAVNGGTHTTAFVLSGSTLTGASHTFQGLATWSGGTITGTAAASTTFGNDLTITGPIGKTLSGGRSVNAGNTLWTGNTGNGNNAINISGGGGFNSNGTFTDANAFNSALNRGNGGGAFNNNGVFNKQSNTTTTIGTAFNNIGTVNVNAGTLLLSSIDASTSSGTFNIASGAKLEYRNGDHVLNNVTTSGGGIFEISTENVGGDAFVAVNGGTHTSAFVLSGSTMGGTDATFQGPVTWSGGTISGAAATTFSNDVAITGPNLKTIVGGRSVNLDGTTTWSGNTANNNNAIRFWNGAALNNNGTFNDANAFASFLEHNVGGPNTFNNAGVYNKLSNTVTTVDLGVVFNNSGTVNLNTGTMRFVSGTQGPTGTVRVASGATFQHDAASTVGNMITAGNLVLADRTLTVHIDYDNANFGVGNAFNRRANVSVTGTGNRLIAAGDANQGITGANVANGTSANPTLVIGNVRVGANTFTYDIANVGTTGPALRGAIQTGVNGGNITDPRLSGSGVTAGNWGPVATGNSVSRDVIVTVDTAGVFTPLGGQAVNILNNFENTRSQLLTITSAAGAAAYNPAAASVAPNPVVLANQRVGTGLTQALTITNTAPGGVFSEGLNASFASVTGNAISNGGSISLLAGGASNNTAMRVGIDSSSAGARTGSVTLALASDGSGTSGLPLLALAPQTVAVSGNVYQIAQGQLNTAPLNFGVVQVGQSVSQTLSISNIATGPAGFVEDLNARFGASSGLGSERISGNGSISGLLAGGTNASGMTVHVDTSSAGNVNGQIAIDFFSAGGVNGTSNGLGELGIGSASYGVNGSIQATVINTANPVINNSPINLGNVRVGDASPTQFVSVTNQATATPQAALNATISGNAPITASGAFNLLAPGGTDNTSLRVGMNTAAAGAINGTATIGFVSDASNVGNCAPNCQFTLPSQDVTVTGGVFLTAQPTLATSVNVGAVRVGGTAQQALSITNTNLAPGFQEGLSASLGGASSGITATGSFTNLAAGATNNSALVVGIDSSTAGVRSGTATLSLVSTGAGTSGLADLALAPRTINVEGKVYTPAVAQLNTTAIDFGIVRVGDTVAARNVSVTNAAASTALNDTLSASMGAATSPFQAGGNASGLGAGASNAAGSLTVGLNTASAGVFNGSASVAFASQNPDMADLTLNSQSVMLMAQVNNLANADFDLLSAIGALSQTGDDYVLDLGTVRLGSTIASLLQIDNDVAGPADFLSGAFDLSAVTDFAYSGWDAFSGLGAGDAFGGLALSFSANALGLFEDTILFAGLSTNASDPNGIALTRSLLIRATVTDGGGTVPEPGTLALLAFAMFALLAQWRRAPRTKGVPHA